MEWRIEVGDCDEGPVSECEYGIEVLPKPESVGMGGGRKE